MTSIVLENLCVDFPVISSQRGHSLKTVVIEKARQIGGRMVDTSTTARAVRALDNVSLSLKEGDRIGLVGHNGSGKTTLLRVMAGIFAPSSGRAEVRGKCVSMFDIGIGIDAEASGYENIYMRGLILGLSETEIADRTKEIAEFSELGDYLELPVRTYSSGMAMRLMFSIATAIEGNIVLMDEWIAVGDEQFRDKANNRLREVTDRAGILVIASHDPGLLRNLCNLGARMEAGRLKMIGPIDEVLDTPG
jgi:ABC-2 type transport system ATP-binding protein/lipopolysaccharide transport system ATP-binding protein